MNNEPQLSIDEVIDLLLYKNIAHAAIWINGEFITPGDEYWLNLDGKLHRDNDLPALITVRGTQMWFHENARHRANGPAIVRADGTVEWWVDGELHNTNGPAATFTDGTAEWWEYGKYIRSNYT